MFTDEPHPANAPPPLQWIEGVPWFHGLRVETRDVCIAGQNFRVASLQDAAALLDQPEFARRFLEEDRAPYGVELWPGALMLAEHILRHNPGHGRIALEIGCGLGFVSLAATRAGWRMTATDHEPAALQFAHYNAGLNDVHFQALRPLDWHHPPDDLRVEHIFAADVLYQLVDHVPILRCLDRLLTPGGVASLADPNRGVADRFAKLAVDHGFELQQRPAEARLDTGRVIQGRIFVLHKPQSGPREQP